MSVTGSIPAASTTETAGQPAAGLWRAAGGSSGVAVAVGLFAATRAVELLLLWWMLPAGGPTVWDRLLTWDAGWFLNVATRGYPDSYSYDAGGELVGNGLAFFPLYPALIRLVDLLGPTGAVAAVTVAWLAATAAAILLYLLGTSLHDRRTGYALMILCCAQPMSVVLSLAYSEALFLALVVAALLAAHRRLWWVAGGLGLAAGLTRPTGVAVALALVVAAAAAPRPGRLRALLAVAPALLAVPAYLLFVGLRVGDLDAWFRIQTAGWGTSFDAGVGTGRFVLETLRGGEGWVPVSVAWLLIAAVVAAVVAVARRVWLPLIVYGMTVLVLAVGQAGYYHSKPRLLVPVLVVLIPAAVVVARSRPSTASAVLVGYAAFGLWYGAYLVAVWPFTI